MSCCNGVHTASFFCTYYMLRIRDLLYWQVQQSTHFCNETQMQKYTKIHVFSPPKLIDQSSQVFEVNADQPHMAQLQQLQQRRSSFKIISLNISRLVTCQFNHESSFDESKLNPNTLSEAELSRKSKKAELSHLCTLTCQKRNVVY